MPETMHLSAGALRGLHCEVRLVEPGGHWCGRIAQLVEQLTLNQRAQGSSPCAPTNDPNIFKDLYSHHRNGWNLIRKMSAACPQFQWEAMMPNAERELYRSARQRGSLVPPSGRWQGPGP